jgi:Xaa-Pro aminopeptidase
VFPSDRVLAAGDRVVLDAGVLVDGYEGGLARTIVCAEPHPDRTPADELIAAVTGAVRAGATGAELWAAWDAMDAPRPAQPVLHGVGLGMEPPVIGSAEEELAAGMTISIRAEVEGWVRRDTVLVTNDGVQPFGTHGYLS